LGGGEGGGSSVACPRRRKPYFRLVISTDFHLSSAITICNLKVYLNVILTAPTPSTKRPVSFQEKPYQNSVPISFLPAKLRVQPIAGPNFPSFTALTTLGNLHKSWSISLRDHILLTYCVPLNVQIRFWTLCIQTVAINVLPFKFVIVAVGGDYVSIELRPLTVPWSIPQIIQEWIQNNGRMILTGENRRTRRKTCPSVTLPTWTDLGANPGLRGEKPATNRLSYGTAVAFILLTTFQPINLCLSSPCVGDGLKCRSVS
jgi:hypothetical protein